MAGGITNIGDVLAGKYRVDKILGIGGMGMVVAATHLDLEHQVAIKFMLPAALESEEASRRFLREARASSALTSEHVCRVLDLGRLDNGAPYIVMEYLLGYDLHSLMKRRGVLKLSDAVDYILQACEGMAEAHMKGIVHRDLKPGNLFLCKRADGSSVIKVLDFGISKTREMTTTKAGDVLGSPAYMSPEQMQSSKDVDARADIWSLGVILYQLVTGRTPFDAESLPQMCLRVLSEDPQPLQDLRADLPDSFCNAVAKALSKSRDDRFSDVGELASAIATFGGDTASFSVTRIAGVLHPSAASSRMSMVQIEQMSELPPTVHESDRLAKTAAVVTTFSSGAGESVNQLPRRWRSYGWLGAAVVAAGVIVLLLVMVMKTGNEPSAANASQATMTVTPIETAPPAAVDPPRIEPPLPPASVPPPDPPVHVVEQTAPPPPKHHAIHKAPKITAVKAAAGSAAQAGSDAVSDDDWTHMQHDRPKPE
jgi:serine/threonine-protein kinase